MRRKLTGFVLAGMLMAAVMMARPAKQADIELQAAIRTETVSGDLKSAIKQYESIVTRYGKSDRTIAATALVRMAECHQKLGDAASSKIYEQILREYGDQTEAVAVARTRLARAAGAAAQAGMTSRRIWKPASQWGLDFITGATISLDGRLLSYTDWVTGYLGVHEFATGRDRYVTNSGYPNFVEESAISRDGKQVAYSWFNAETDRYELRVASLQGDGLPQSRLLFDKEEFDWLMPNDWSPDGNWIAVQMSRKDNSGQMALVSVRDGSARVLKSPEWLGASEAFFSPDGKYLGFDSPVGANRDQRDVFTLGVDGSSPLTVAAGSGNDTMMGWSPDGKYLLFASNRSGTVGLWGISIADGKPQGTPELIKSDISRFSLGVTASGSLYSAVPLGDRDIQIASVDFETGKLVSAPVRPIQSFVGSNLNPNWSADGKYLAYRSERNQLGRSSVLGILSLETGEVRELTPQLRNFQNPRWTPDGRSLVVGGRDLKGVQGQYEIDLKAGELRPIVSAPGFSSPDGRKVYDRKVLGKDFFSFVQRDLASGQEREIIRRKGLGYTVLSPDGQFIATTENESALLLIPVAGGDPRELLRVTRPEALARNGLSWMPDGRALLVTKGLNEYTQQQTELLLVPIDAGQPRRIDIGSGVFEGVVRVHPDGRQIAYVAGERKQEVWVLENFLPARSAKE